VVEEEAASTKSECHESEKLRSRSNYDIYDFVVVAVIIYVFGTLIEEVEMLLCCLFVCVFHCHIATNKFIE
jgi:hypothetical protein